MTKVGVLRGGPSGEYDVSLKTGATILKNLPEGYIPVDIYISKEGDWHLGGVVRSPEQISREIDIAFNALHGEYGEDGKIQGVLENLGIPYTGSKSLASAIGMNKVLSKKAFRKEGIKTPSFMIARKGEVSAKDIFLNFTQPSVVKPATGGSSLGVRVVHTLNELEEALEDAFSYSGTVLVEEYIQGKEATCGVIDSFRGENRYSCMPTEIINLKKEDIWGYESKYSNDMHELRTPGNFSLAEKGEMQDLAKLVHDSLDLRHYSRTDFIVHPKRGIYVLEVNTLPGLTETSLFPHGLQASGASLGEFFDHIIKLSLYGR